MSVEFWLGLRNTMLMLFIACVELFDFCLFLIFYIGDNVWMSTA